MGSLQQEVSKLRAALAKRDAHVSQLENSLAQVCMFTISLQRI